jgi:hypothetical protein
MVTVDSEGRGLYKLGGITYLAEQLMLRWNDWYYEIRLRVNPDVMVGTTTQPLECVDMED